MQNGAEKGSLLEVIHIEDNEDDSELIRIALKRGGVPCEITRVVTRDQFQSVIENRPVDLILSDSQVPGFDALSALAFTRERKPELPFVFVSGHGGPRLSEDVMKNGATGFVPKENLSALVEIVKHLWERKANPTLKKLPKVDQYVTVQCLGFRCLGFLDRDGNWRDFERREVLPEVLDWFEI